MKRCLSALLVSAVLATPAWSNPVLAQQKNCMACHTIDRKIVGPAYRDVAKKYAGQDVAARLAVKIRQGGKGVWGVIPMPANPKVSEDEARQLANWVLSLR